MILHAAEVARSGFVVHIYSQDTDVLLLALRRVPELGSKAALIMGSGEHHHKVMLKTHVGETWAREISCFNQLAHANWMQHYRAHTTKGQTRMLHSMHSLMHVLLLLQMQALIWELMVQNHLLK